MAPPCYPLSGNGNGQQQWWQKGSMKGSNQPTVYDLQRQLKQVQLANQKQMAQVNALLMGKGKGKGYDKGKGKGSGQDKGKGKGKGNNAWAKAYSFGIQVEPTTWPKLSIRESRLRWTLKLPKLRMRTLREQRAMLYLPRLRLQP